MIDVLGYLTSKNLFPKRASGLEYHMACPFCGEDPARRGRLYVNCDDNADIPGLFMCHLCGEKGSLVSLQRFFGDATETQEKEDDGFIRRVIFDSAAAYYHDGLTDNEKVYGWLKNTRGISLETISKHQLGFAEGGLFEHLRGLGFKVSDILATGLIHEDRNTKKLTDYFTCHLTIPYHVSGNVVQIRGRDLRSDADKKYLTSFGQKARLFNTDVVWDANEIVITEGELDCLVLEQLGFNAVGLPGAGSWQKTWNDYFTDVKRIYVLFDADQAGRSGAERVLQELGDRARAVEIPTPGCDVTDWTVRDGHAAEDVRLLLRGSGKGLLVTVDEAYAEHQKVQGQSGLRLGWSVLDRLIAPGLLPAQVMVFLAKSGAGKTITLLNMFQGMTDAQPDIKILFCSLEQTRGEWFERARRIYRFHHPLETDQEVLDHWRERLLIVDRNRLSYGQLQQAYEDFEYEMGRAPDVIAIDYLGYWARSFKGEEYQRLSDAVMALKEFAKDAQRPIAIPHQVNRSVMYGSETSADAARGSGVIEETADFVFGMWSEDSMHGKQAEDKTGQVRLKIHKSRHGGSGQTVDFFLAPRSLVLVEAYEERKNAHTVQRIETQSARWAKNEVHYLKHYPHESWEQAQLRHLSGMGIDEADFSKVELAVKR